VDCLFVCVLTIFRSRVVYFSCTLLTKKVWVVFYAADGMMDPASVSMGRELVGPILGFCFASAADGCMPYTQSLANTAFDWQYVIYVGRKQIFAFTAQCIFVNVNVYASRSFLVN